MYISTTIYIYIYTHIYIYIYIHIAGLGGCQPFSTCGMRGLSSAMTPAPNPSSRDAVNPNLNQRVTPGTRGLPLVVEGALQLLSKRHM